MSVVVSVLGLIAIAAGCAGFVFGLSIKEFSFGSTLMITGTMGVIGGLLLVAAGAVIRELHRFGTMLAHRPPLRFPPRPGEVGDPYPPGFARPAMAPPSRLAPMPPPAAPVAAAAPAYESRGVPASAVHEPPQHEPKPEPAIPAAAVAVAAAAGAVAVGAAAVHGVSEKEAETAEAADTARRDLTEHEQAVARALSEPAALDEPSDEPSFPSDEPSFEERRSEHAADAALADREHEPDSEPEPAPEEAALPPETAREPAFAFSFREPEPRAPADEDAAMADLHDAMEEVDEVEPARDERPAERARVSPFDAIWPPRAPAAPRHSEPEPEEPEFASHAEFASREDDDHHPPTAEAPDIAPADEPETTWPHERHPVFAADVEREETDMAEAEAPEPKTEPAHPVSILKSGVVDGMGYALYSDGSIEAELPSGTIRFASINELREHLEKAG